MRVCSVAAGGCLRYRRLTPKTRRIAESTGIWTWSNVFASTKLPQAIYLLLLREETFAGSHAFVPYLG